MAKKSGSHIRFVRLIRFVISIRRIGCIRFSFKQEGKKSIYILPSLKEGLYRRAYHSVVVVVSCHSLNILYCLLNIDRIFKNVIDLESPRKCHRFGKP